MLNAHPEIISVGELIDLNRRLQPSDNGRYTPCSCGAPSLWQCEFWSRVNEVAQQTEGKSLGELDVRSYSDLDERRSPNAAVFRAISKAAGGRFIVDSSKRPGRLSYLMQLKGVEVFPIHLVRDPRGQICSMVRKSGGFFKHIYNYTLIHERIKWMLRATPHAVVQYEELVHDPERTLGSVLEPLGLRFDSRQLLGSEQVQHTLSGNKFRWRPNGIVLDQRWKQSLSQSQQLAIRLGTAYSWHRLGKPTRER